MAKQENMFDRVESNGPGWWTLNTDGAARGNPGPAGAGAVLRDDRGVILEEISRYLGIGTNNEAEYQGLILGLETAISRGARRLNLRLDSELVVRQIQGRYKVRHERLQPLYNRAMGLLQDLEAYDIVHVRREQNAEADALAAKAADRRK